MLIPVPPSECMRAREAASGRLDGELSEIEAVRLDAHLRACAECREFAGQIAVFTHDLRETPLERSAAVTFEPSRARARATRVHGTVAAAMAAVAAASVALGHLHLGVNSAPRRVNAIRSISGNVGMLRYDAVQQRIYEMLPAADRWRAELQDRQTPAL
jgi:predicted anti-sigma-YlaC factor YlaD